MCQLNVESTFRICRKWQRRWRSVTVMDKIFISTPHWIAEAVGTKRGQRWCCAGSLAHIIFTGGARCFAGVNEEFCSQRWWSRVSQPRNVGEVRTGESGVMRKIEWTVMRWRKLLCWILNWQVPAKGLNRYFNILLLWMLSKEFLSFYSKVARTILHNLNEAKLVLVKPLVAFFSLHSVVEV